MNRRDALKYIGSSATTSLSLYGLDRLLDTTTNLQYAIKKSVRQSNIASAYEPWFGDCWHIAVALHDLYGTDIYGVKHKEKPEYPIHVFVEADGRFFDGKGAMTISELKKVWPKLSSKVNHHSKEYIVKTPYYRKSIKNDIQHLISKTRGYQNWSP